MNLYPIGRHGELREGVDPDDYLQMVIDMTVSHYEQTGFPKPWIGYLAMDDSGPTGVCGFKSAPINGRVEIAYGTMPGHEGRGVATAMARELIRIARREAPKLIVFAQTLPQEGASTTILKKLGFTMTGSVEHPDDGTVWEWELHPGV